MTETTPVDDRAVPGVDRFQRYQAIQAASAAVIVAMGVLLTLIFPAASVPIMGLYAVALAALAFVWHRFLDGLAGAEVRRTRQAIVEAKERAELSSNVDSLTGLYNRRHLDTLLPQEIERARRHDRPLSLLMIDSDHLKEVNDTLGHLYGDQLLIDIAQALAEQVRLVDTVVRFGGDEFVVVMPDTDSEGAQLPANRIREAMDDHEIRANGTAVRTTISLGLATFPDDAEDAPTLLNKADIALYASKRGGRNRVTIYHPSLATSSPAQN